MPERMSIPVVNYTFPLEYADKTNPSVPDITVLKSDTGTRKLNITLKNGGTAIDLTDLTPRIYFKKADGNITQGDPTVVDAVTGQIAYTLQTNDVSKIGQVICQITLSDALGNRVTTFYFDFNVLDTAYSDEAVQSTTEFSLLTQYADNLRHKGEYAAETTYYINNIVTYSGSSYIALQTTQGNTPPIYPDLYTDYWYVISNGYATTASGVSIEDSRGYYAASHNFTTASAITEVESALKDLGAFKRMVPETGWVYSDDINPIIVLKKPIAEHTMIKQPGEYGAVGSYAYLTCSIAGGKYGILVDEFVDASYTYAAIMLITDGGTSASGTFPGSSDTFDVYFSHVLSPPIGLTSAFLDNDNFTMKWSYTGFDTVNLESSDWVPISTEFVGKIPAYGDYFLEINALMLNGGKNIYVSVTDDISGTVLPLDGAFTDYLPSISLKWRSRGLISGNGTERNIYVIGSLDDEISATLTIAGSNIPSYMQIWPACLPVMGGVAI